MFFNDIFGTPIFELKMGGVGYLPIELFSVGIWSLPMALLMGLIHRVVKRFDYYDFKTFTREEQSLNLIIKECGKKIGDDTWNKFFELSDMKKNLGYSDDKMWQQGRWMFCKKFVNKELFMIPSN